MLRIPILHAGILEAFPPVASALREPNGLVAAGGDLAPERLLEAYRHGIFPWFSEGEPILWWSPDPRTVFRTDAVHVSRKLRRRLAACGWTVRADTAFDAVLRACAAPRAKQRGGTWITRGMRAAYQALHDMGYAHSIEVFDAGGELAGGIYGVALGHMFFGESMFSRQTDGSKIALLALCRALHAWGFDLMDAQVASPHLATLGAFEMPRAQFVAHVQSACALPEPPGTWRERWTLTTAAMLAFPAPSGAQREGAILRE